jgi:hypothetical protein
MTQSGRVTQSEIGQPTKQRNPEFSLKEYIFDMFSTENCEEGQLKGSYQLKREMERDTARLNDIGTIT